MHTGDLGLFDERGYLFVRDRLREVIITGGFNVYPSDVETVLSQHPGIAECAVVGIPDDHWGEAVHAAVEAKPDTKLNPDEIMAFVKRELGRSRRQKSCTYFHRCPKSPVGKVLKTSVRDKILKR